MPLNLDNLNDAQKALVNKISAEDLAALEGIFKPARKRSYVPRIGLKTVLNVLKTTNSLPEEDCDVDKALHDLYSVLEIYFAGQSFDTDRAEALVVNETWNKAKDKVKQGAILAYIKFLQKISRKRRKSENEVEAVQEAPKAAPADLPDFDEDEDVFDDVDIAAQTGVPL